MGKKLLSVFQNEKHVMENLLPQHTNTVHITDPRLQIAGSQDIHMVKT